MGLHCIKPIVWVWILIWVLVRVVVIGIGVVRVIWICLPLIGVLIVSCKHILIWIAHCVVVIS